jgi:hypothetical protein
VNILFICSIIPAAANQETTEPRVKIEVITSKV